MAKFKPYFEVSIPKDYTPEERRAIAAEIIDYVISRTESGLDKGNRKFQKYSKAYAKEKGQTNVDLKLSEEMLFEMSLLKTPNGLIRIGYNGDSDVVGKVEGNVLGTYGNDRPVTKGRNFLGITKSDLRTILKDYPIRDKEARQERVNAIKNGEIVDESIAIKSGLDTGGE